MRLAWHLMLLLSLSSIVFNCQTEIKVSPQSKYYCTFQFNYTDEECSKFEFTRCEWYRCPSYGQFSECSIISIFESKNWSQCSSQCCPPGTTNSPNQTTLSLIKQKWPFLFYVLIFLWSVVILMLIIFAIMEIRECCLKKEKCINCRAKILGRMKKISECLCRPFREKPQSLDERGQQAHAMEEFLHDKMASGEEMSSMKEKECSICLKDRSNLQLSCGHSYHRQCILKWFGHKRECSICRNSDVESVKVYCEGCFLRYAKFHLDEQESHFKQYKFVVRPIEEMIAVTVCQNLQDIYVTQKSSQILKHQSTNRIVVKQLFNHLKKTIEKCFQRYDKVNLDNKEPSLKEYKFICSSCRSEE